MHLVTVAVAAYNVEKYIGEMLSSIITQTYSNLEILIVNDGSTDGTKAICESFSDPRIRIITKENGGLSTARQTAINEAKGEYLCLVDGDDVLCSDYVQTLYSAAVANDADIAVCEYQEFSESVTALGRHVVLPHTTNYKVTPQLLKTSFYHMVEWFKLADSWNKMYKTEFLRGSQEVFSLDKRYNGTDLLFNHLLALHCPRYAVCHKVLLYYRLTPNSRVRRKNKDLQTGFSIIMEKLLSASASIGLGDEVKDQLCHIYDDMMRRALSDLYVNSDGKRDFKDKYTAFLEKFISFKKICFSNCSSRGYEKGLRLFLFILGLRSATLMTFYLKRRQRKIAKSLRKA